MVCFVLQNIPVDQWLDMDVFLVADGVRVNEGRRWRNKTGYINTEVGNNHHYDTVRNRQNDTNINTTLRKLTDTNNTNKPY